MFQQGSVAALSVSNLWDTTMSLQMSLVSEGIRLLSGFRMSLSTYKLLICILWLSATNVNRIT